MRLGAFGNVKLASLKKNKKQMFALKAMKKQDIIQCKHVDHIENEKKILELINHPFIVSVFSLNLSPPFLDEILRIHAR